MDHSYDMNWLREKYDHNDPMKFIFFWGHAKNPNGEIFSTCFSQWYESSFEINGLIFPTSEHWMMSQKALLFDNEDIHEQILQTDNPGKVKKLGRQVTGFDIDVWKKHRKEIVRIGNIHKFNQNKELGEYLLNTNNRIIVEASPRDRIWGIGLSKNNDKIKNIHTWRGLNLLGFVLMETRDFFTEHGFFENDFNFNPPWITETQLDAENSFWTQRKGEKILLNFNKNWAGLESREKEIYKISFPEPKNWKGFYE